MHKIKNILITWENSFNTPANEANPVKSVKMDSEMFFIMALTVVGTIAFVGFTLAHPENINFVVG